MMHLKAYKAERANMAEQEIITMEVRQQLYLLQPSVDFCLFKSRVRGVLLWATCAVRRDHLLQLWVAWRVGMLSLLLGKRGIGQPNVRRVLPLCAWASCGQLCGDHLRRVRRRELLCALMCACCIVCVAW
jgi:hypothetical protein